MNKKNFIFFLIAIFLTNCSFDNKTGIWGGSEEEKRQILDIEKQQKKIIKVDKIYSSDRSYSKEKSLNQNITLTKPTKNLVWEVSALNNQNFLGNLYLSSIDNTFLKKKIGKNKFSISKNNSSLLAVENNLIFSDDAGTIFNIYEDGKIKWKQNIYKKIFKKIYKNLALSIYKNIIYVSDNIGFVYAINIENGEIIWIKNHGVSLKSNIKIFNNKIFLIDHDNKIICLSAKDGSIIWNIFSISSFIKSQNYLSLAVTRKGDLFAINSSADLFKISSIDGKIYWSSNLSSSMLADASDFFESSEIVVVDDVIIFSAESSIYSYNIATGIMNWQSEPSSAGTPIVVEKNIYVITKNGFFVILDKDTGKVTSSTNILKILKRKKQKTTITGFIMGSGKVYASTLNGYLIVSSAATGKVESFKKIGDSITITPIINSGKLYILTEDSRIIGLN